MLNLCVMRCDLRKGSTIIGSVWLVFSALVIVAALLITSLMMQVYEEEYRHYTGTIKPELQILVALSLGVLRTVFYGVTAVAVVDAVFSIMLIIGACQDKPRLVLSWVMEQMGLLPIWTLLVLAFTVYCYMIGQLLSGTITLLVLLVRTGVTVYCMLVVYRLYRYLRRHQVPTIPIRAV